ncbi:MAG TPA: 2-oxo acid dehydrogenase subunit E2 [Marmoricola sp.]|nr:2-oxo acid dehydrogenase subunit E2 [Marmoricola sp.]
MFTRRRDATYVRDLPAFRRIVPYLMRTRTEAAVYFPQRIEVDELLAWLDEVNADRSEEDRLTLFHVLVTAIARAMKLRPELNRFVVGRRTYQHDEISIAFVVKTAMAEDAPETEVRLVFTGEETVEQVRDRVESAVARKRATLGGKDDQLVELFAPWPRPVLDLIARLVARLDYHNALPSFLQDAIPLYTSVYLVNVGSIGIDPPFHHLYEYGSASVFVAIGAIRKEPVVDEQGAIVVRSCLQAVYTLDERASDGFSFARTAEVFRRLVSQPALLAQPQLTVDDILAGWPHGA